LNYQGACGKIHGHTYRVEITVGQKGLELPESGMLLDFARFSEVGDWIIENWDHALLLNPQDPLVPVLKVYGQKVWAEIEPTAENMAKYLLEEIVPSIWEGDLVCVSVREGEGGVSQFCKEVKNGV